MYTIRRFVHLVRSRWYLCISLLAIAVLFAACKKDVDNGNANIPVSGLMAFNLVADKPAIAVALSGSSLTNAPLNYTSYTGTYLNIFPGSREVAAYAVYEDSALAIATQNFVAKQYYSLFTIGANRTYRNVIVNDGLDSLTPGGGQAFVRYINAIPDSSSPAVMVTAAGTSVLNEHAAFGSVAEFKGINPGEITIGVANGGNIAANRTITVEKGKVYTVLLVGIPGNTDPAKAVQIKYITNGSLE